MATLRMTQPWADTRTGMLYFRRKIPKRYVAVSGQSSDIVKISLQTKDRKQIAKPWAAALTRWAELEAEWERKLNVVPVTPTKAQELAARWASWVAADPERLQREGARASTFDESGASRLDEAIFDELSRKRKPKVSREEVRDRRLAAHASEAAALAGITISDETMPTLVAAMQPAVYGAYRQAEIRKLGIIQGVGKRWTPLEEARRALPEVPDAPLPKPAAPIVSLDDLFEQWRTVAVVKPRTITETGYILKQLITHLGHKDAAAVTRADLASWRDALKASGLSNTTWNNRLSLIRQVFEWGRKEQRLATNVADADLRLSKSKGATRLPYDDEDTVKILTAARRENRASLRWAPWIMAFSGMRVGEVLQLSVTDVRHEDGVWFMAVHEDDEGKSVKTGQRRNVPIHSALIAEGFLDYVKSLPADGPVFPDKQLDTHGQRGGRAWNVTGKWIRLRVGLDDPRKAPNHAFRHRMEDEMRAAEVPEDVRDAIVGHARKTTGKVYGVRGEALKRLSRYLERVQVPSQLQRPQEGPCPERSV